VSPLAALPSIGAALAARRPRREPVPEAALRAAVAIVLAPGPADLELLLIRRAERAADPWSGHMALPGGRADPGDHDLSTTARRETAEETGVVLAADTLLGELDDLAPPRRRLPPLVVRPFVFALPARPAVAVDANEVAYHRWVPLADFSSARADEIVEVGGERRSVPGYRFGEDFVWGLTHRILEPFLAIALAEGRPVLDHHARSRIERAALPRL
jgi:8-oxo-dGTP pyrophosphatase MutT (NUDIX family)